MTLPRLLAHISSIVGSVPMKPAAIIAALGIALIVSMGPAPTPASAQTIMVRDCGGHYVVARFNADGSAIGVWNKQLSDQGTIYTAGKTWTLVEGSPDRFVSDGGAQLQVVACDATLGSSTRGVQQQGVQGTQTTTTLVSNTGQGGNTTITLSTDFAQTFTTGSNSLGYKLTSVQFRLQLLGSVPQPNYSVYITEDSGGTPGTSLGTLPGGTQLTASLTLQTFTASDDGIDLDPETTYWVVIDPVSGSDTTRLRVTSSHNEDTGGASGWSMGNNRLTRNKFDSNWNNHTKHVTPVKLAVNGYEKTAPRPANFDCNAYLGWEHTNGRQWDSADRVWRRVGSYYYTGDDYANTGEPICELRFSSVGPGSYADKLGYGLTLCSQAPTWQTIDPETGEAVGGSDEKHYTGQKTSSGQDICSDFDGLRSTRDYLREQHRKNNP